MADSFKVIGRNILPNDCFKYKQKQPSRKFFNTSWLSVDEFQHETANHYRDYKHRQKSRRIRKGSIRHKKVIFRDQVCDYRDVLKVNRIDFPPTTRDFSLRGNLAKSRLQPLGNVYDNTLRRILTANTLNELEFLTKRQENFFKFRKGLTSHRGVSINCSKYKHSASNTRCNRTNQKRHSLGHIISDTFEPFHFHNHLEGERPSIAVVYDKKLSLYPLYEGGNEKDKYFLQLASECYSEGFLAHIKYLESIGERNAINNQISKQSKLRHFAKNTTDSRPQSVESNVSSSNSIEDLSNSYGVKGFISVVKRILKTRRDVQNPCNYVEGVIQQDWKIRVNITRSSSPESLHSSRSSIQEPHDNITSNHCIMSDTFNEGQAKKISACNESSVKRQNFHDLIENLNNLEIGKVGSLPKIVLTDFSTSNIATDSVTPPRAAKSHENVITKQQSLEVDLPSLTTPLTGVCQNMVTVEHHHQNTSASPPHQHSTSVEDNIPPNNMSQNQTENQPGDTAVIKSSDTPSKEATKSAVSQRSIDLKITKKPQITTQEITKKVLKLDLVSPKDLEDYPVKSPKSPVAVRMPHQTSLTSSVDVEDRKTLREALYQGIFHRHRRTIFAVGSFLRMLRSRNSQYNTIRSSSEGEDMDETR